MLVGTVAKTPGGVIVQVRLIKVATGEAAFGKEYTGSVANPRRYAHTIWDEMYKDQMQGRGVARTRLTFSSDRTAELVKRAGREPRRPGDLHRRLRRRQSAQGDQHHDAEHHADVVARRPGDRVYQLPPVRRHGHLPGHRPVVSSRPASGTTPANGDPSKQNYLPIWSPDGSKLAFTHEPRRQPRDLRDEPRRQRRAADDQQPGDRRVADVVADRQRRSPGCRTAPATRRSTS